MMWEAEHTEQPILRSVCYLPLFMTCKFLYIQWAKDKRAVTTAVFLNNKYFIKQIQQY